MKVDKISELTTNRLSVYLRCLTSLSRDGVKTISSQDLAEQFHLNSAQIRKDLAYFGEFGVRGVGYYVEDLRNTLTGILGLENDHCVCIIGAGRLGAALADYYGFKQSNFKVVALFDSEAEKIGQKIGKAEIPVYAIEKLKEIVVKEEIDVAIIAVPVEFAEEVLEKITKAGIKAVLNFAPIPLQSKNGVKVKTVDLTISLESLSYFLAQPTSAKTEENLSKLESDKRRKTSRTR